MMAHGSAGKCSTATCREIIPNVHRLKRHEINEIYYAVKKSSARSNAILSAPAFVQIIGQPTCRRFVCQFFLCPTGCATDFDLILVHDASEP